MDKTITIIATIAEVGFLAAAFYGYPIAALPALICHGIADRHIEKSRPSGQMDGIDK